MCRALLVIASFHLLSACQSATNENVASLVLVGGNVITVDPTFSRHSAIGIRDNEIIAVGSDDDIRNLIGSNTEVIELQGRTVLPGLIDVHGHIHSYGRLLQNLDLNGTSSYEEIVQMVADRVATLEPGMWVIGQGWDQNEWDNKEFPHHAALSEVSPHNPVILNRTDGHAVLVNQSAMDIAQIDASSPDPDGGRIVRGDTGDPTGVFLDLAEELIRQHEPVTDQLIRERARLTSEALLAVGVTSVHDLGVSPQELQVFKQLDNAQELQVRIYGMFDDPVGDVDYENFFASNIVNPEKVGFLTVNGIKLFRDGALGSRGALMIDPYSDNPGNHGIPVASEQHIYDVTKTALQNGVQVTTHAIGDAAIRSTLDSYERALREVPITDHRLRMEHAQIIQDEDIERFADMGVIVSVQPSSVISDMSWTETRVGADRVRGAYRFKDFIRSGATLTFSSDFPTESINPFQTMYRAVTRKDEHGNPENGWQPEQALTIEEALKAQTIWAAMAGFQEDSIGSIEVGKLADLVVVSQDVLDISPEQIKDTVVEMTIVDGRVSYRAQ